MTTMDENMNWMKLTHLLSNFSLNLRAPFCTSTFTPRLIIAFSTYTLEKNNTSPLSILCTLVPPTIVLLTLMLVCTWYGESTQGTHGGMVFSWGGLLWGQHLWACGVSCMQMSWVGGRVVGQWRRDLAILRPLRNLWLHSDNTCGHVSLSSFRHSMWLGLGNFKAKTIFSHSSHVLCWPKFYYLCDSGIGGFHNELNSLWWIWSLNIHFFAKLFSFAIVSLLCSLYINV